VNGQPGYRWQPNDAPSVRPVNAPELMPGDVLVHDEPGRCGGLDSHCHHFRVIYRGGSWFLLTRHGGGDEAIHLFGRTIEKPLAALDTHGRYWVLHALHSAHRDGARHAREAEALRWRVAAVEKRIKVRKVRGKAVVLVELKPET
jgi:hypothetical protein